MELKIEIDCQSGFCNGVIRAVECAEKNLRSISPLFSLGAIVHNGVELERLKKLGLTMIDSAHMKTMRGGTVLIRAHGEPPATYEIAKENNITLIDCTCPVVLKLQERIRKRYAKIREEGGNGQIVIFGKENHAEVNGLVGQIGKEGIVVDIEELNPLKIKGMEKIDFGKDIHIFSQTTKDPNEYGIVCNYISEKLRGYGEKEGTDRKIYINDTICKQVAGRQANLVDFAKNHDVILFVSGNESSNGKILYDLCKSINIRSYHIQSAEHINKEWLNEGESVGICGATSTPKWQLEEAAKYLTEL